MSLERIRQYFIVARREINSGEPLKVGRGLTKIFLAVVLVLAVSPQNTELGGWQFRLVAFLFSPSNEIGDTFAGLAGVLAFLWIIVTVWLQSQALNEQRTELQETREELRLSRLAHQDHLVSLSDQRFETTFFEMLTTHMKIVEALKKGSGIANSVVGREVFKEANKALKFNYHQLTNLDDKEDARIYVSHKAYWEHYRPTLAHYFRFLFNLFRYLDEKGSENDFHAKLVRSQLSDEELILLYYNCFSEHGEKFKKFAIKFELFDNLDKSDLFNSLHSDLMDPAAFGLGDDKRNSP